MENWSNNSMHTFIEGILPYAGGSTLYSISQIEPNVTVQQINFRMSIPFDSMIIGRANKPYLLKAFLKPREGFSPTQSATQHLAFIQYLPRVLTCLLTNEYSLPYLELLLQIEEMIGIVFAPVWTDSLLFHLSNLVTMFLSKFKTLYPDLPITSKMHFLVHYESIIKKMDQQKIIGAWITNGWMEH